MISLRLKLSVYILISGFLCGFVLAFFFMSANCNSQPSQSLPTNKIANKDIGTIEKGYQKQIAVLQKQNSELQQELQTTQSRLELSKQSVKQKESNIKKIIQSNNPQRKVLPFENYSVALFDTEPCECDSLKNEVTNYINENHRKDSLYEMQLATMDSVVSVKDSIINVNKGLYNSLHTIYNQTIAAQQFLQTENRLLKKKEKRRKVKNRLLATGLLIISGSFIHFIHH